MPDDSRIIFFGENDPLLRRNLLVRFPQTSGAPINSA
jgi:hypothetical protein